MGCSSVTKIFEFREKIPTQLTMLSKISVGKLQMFIPPIVFVVDAVYVEGILRKLRTFLRAGRRRHHGYSFRDIEPIGTYLAY